MWLGTIDGAIELLSGCANRVFVSRLNPTEVGG
jgi:hypothetical protein